MVKKHIHGWGCCCYLFKVGVKKHIQGWGCCCLFKSGVTVVKKHKCMRVSVHEYS